MFLMRVAEQQSRAMRAQKKNAAYMNAAYSNTSSSGSSSTPKGKKVKKSGRYGKNLHPNLMSVYGIDSLETPLPETVGGSPIKLSRNSAIRVSPEPHRPKHHSVRRHRDAVVSGVLSVD